MMGLKRPLLFLLIFLILINTFLISRYLSVNETQIENTIFENLKTNELLIKLNIMDIYRLDISCDYIVKDLYQKINPFYKNDKICSLSSLKPNVDEMVIKSINQSRSIDKYSPIFAADNYDPFDDNSVNHPQFDELEKGGLWVPSLISYEKKCLVNDLDFVVFVIPYSSSRKDNLKLLLLNIHSYLQTVEKAFKYQIVVVEQVNQDVLFNKGRLINRGVKYIIDTYKDVDCIVIHDVDLIPSHDSSVLKENGDYRCRQMPWHMSNQVYLMSNKQSRVYNKFLTGGILSLRPGHILNANGFSNEYFGWGAEDDDWTLRMFTTDLCIMRPVINTPTAPFIMLYHEPSKANTKRFQQLSTALVTKYTDGLSNIENLTDLVEVKKYSTFTHLVVDVIKR